MMYAICQIYRGSLRPDRMSYVDDHLPAGLDAMVLGPYDTQEEAEDAAMWLDQAILYDDDGRSCWDKAHEAYLAARRV